MLFQLTIYKYYAVGDRSQHPYLTFSAILFAIEIENNKYQNRTIIDCYNCSYNCFSRPHQTVLLPNIDILVLTDIHNPVLRLVNLIENDINYGKVTMTFNDALNYCNNKY